MADIVERLRGLADVFEAQHAPHNLVLHVRAGADEIERLRAGGCARDQGTTQYCAEAAKMAVEITSLLNVLADERTENMRLRAALELYRDAVRIDATMEGPKFMGANSSALKRAWDADLAALEGK